MQLSLDFEVRCEDSVARGAVRINSANPVNLDVPVSAAGMDRNGLIGQAVTLDGSASSPVAGIVSYHWAQVDATYGLNIEISDKKSASTTFTANLGDYAVDPSQEYPLRFQLVVENELGFTDTDEVVYMLKFDETTNVDSNQSVASNAESLFDGSGEPDATQSGGGGGAMRFEVFFMLIWGLWKIRRSTVNGY